MVYNRRYKTLGSAYDLVVIFLEESILWIPAELAFLSILLARALEHFEFVQKANFAGHQHNEPNSKMLRSIFLLAASAAAFTAPSAARSSMMTRSAISSKWTMMPDEPEPEVR
jgi:hypothetical protein